MSASPESLVDLIRAHLKREGLVLCSSYTGAPVDGEREAMALREIGVLVQDADRTAPAPESWDDDVTAPLPRATIQHLRALSVSNH